jgi:hypothetical protein
MKSGYGNKFRRSVNPRRLLFLFLAPGAQVR